MRPEKKYLVHHLLATAFLTCAVVAPAQPAESRHHIATDSPHPCLKSNQDRQMPLLLDLDAFAFEEEEENDQAHFLSSGPSALVRNTHSPKPDDKSHSPAATICPLLPRPPPA